MFSEKKALTLFALVILLGGFVLLAEAEESDADPTHSASGTYNKCTKTQESSGVRFINYTVKPTSGYYVPLKSDTTNFTYTPIEGVTVTYTPSSDRLSATVNITWTEAKDAESFDQKFTITCLQKVVVKFSFNPSVTSKDSVDRAPGESYSFKLNDVVGYDLPKTVTVTNKGTLNVSSTKSVTIPSSYMTAGSTLTVQIAYEIKKMTVNVQATNLTHNAPASVNYGSSLSFTLTPKEGYHLPTDINVQMGGSKLTNVYSNGKVTISKVTDSVSVEAVGVPNVYTITYKWYDEKKVIDFGEGYSTYTYNVAKTLPNSLPSSTERLLDKITDSSGKTVTTLVAGTIGDVVLLVYYHDDMAKADRSGETEATIWAGVCVAILGLLIFISRK